jgi:hypothetical protein
MTAYMMEPLKLGTACLTRVNAHDQRVNDMLSGREPEILRNLALWVK